ncbi:TPA: hypothetical protein JG871_003941 [Enterobacter hormaechei subsp. xiangfangensis]|nr:hypothetical protein [Enterobacter hormaechei subsp. xiangfangensis]
MKKTLLISLLALTGMNVAHAADIAMPADQIAKLRTMPGVSQLACDEFTVNEFADYKGQSLTPIKDILHGRRLLDGAKVTCNLDKSYKFDGKYELVAKESGTLNGKAMHFYRTDGSTTIGEPGANDSWSIGCKIDPMNDTKSCNMSNGDLFIWRDKSGWSVFVSGGDHYPGTSSSIRINGGKPFTTGDNDGMFSHAVSARIVDQLKGGAEVLTRYTDWPYNSYKDGTVDTTNVEAALNYLDLIYKNF